eukprot:5914244-Heterocapsa_arctica.AAC.1
MSIGVHEEDGVSSRRQGLHDTVNPAKQLLYALVLFLCARCRDRVQGEYGKVSDASSNHAECTSSST